MRFELFLVMIFFLSILLICAELLWLYLLADNQEESKAKLNKKEARCRRILEAIICAPTQSAWECEINELVNLVDKDDSYMEILTDIFMESLEKYEEMSEKDKKIIGKIIEKVNPITYYENMIKENDVVKKCYACQRLAALGAANDIEGIRELLKSRNRQLRYAAGNSLAALGDKEGVEEFILGFQDDYKYSYRVINEVIDRYTGDLYEISKDLIEKGDAYLKATVIKSIGKYKIKELVPYVLECTNDTDINIKIAATKAMCFCAEKEHILTLIRLSKDQNWVVRKFAVKALGNLNTDEAIEAVKQATQDEQWWVRQTAAESLIKMDYSLEHIESVIKGYDRYASEAVKYSLYKVLNMEEKN